MVLRDDISFSESQDSQARYRTIGEIFELEESAQIDPEQEQLNIRLEVEDESDEVDTEHPPTPNLEIEDDCDN